MSVDTTLIGRSWAVPHPELELQAGEDDDGSAEEEDEEMSAVLADIQRMLSSPTLRYAPPTSMPAIVTVIGRGTAYITKPCSTVPCVWTQLTIIIHA